MSKKEAGAEPQAVAAVDSVAKAANRALIWWCIGTLLAVGSSWFLLKGDGRQLVAAPGELLITMSRPTAIEPPYPVQDLGGQWGLLVLGELNEKYARMAMMIGIWLAGTGMLFLILLKKLRTVGLTMIDRLVISLAGLSVFAGGVLLLQAAFRSGVNFQRMADVTGGVDPFTAAELLPLSLATKACIWFAVASLLLALGVGLTLRPKAVKSYSPPSYRISGARWCAILSFAALAVLLVYSVMTRMGSIPELLQLRLDVMTEPRIVKQLNEMWAGLRWSALGVQLGGLLWVVAAWVAPAALRRQ